uniref:Uncharacterized protein n=1 Tax=Oryza sativa subsp. japonica TaxID=39947 RepID=Q6ZDF4_ORYSJ|nr:hypothetical protein [Oryza sativa Japonica Group]
MAWPFSSSSEKDSGEREQADGGKGVGRQVGEEVAAWITAHREEQGDVVAAARISVSRADEGEEAVVQRREGGGGAHNRPTRHGGGGHCRGDPHLTLSMAATVGCRRPRTPPARIFAAHSRLRLPAAIAMPLGVPAMSPSSFAAVACYFPATVLLRHQEEDGEERGGPFSPSSTVATTLLYFVDGRSSGHRSSPLSTTPDLDIPPDAAAAAFRPSTARSRRSSLRLPTAAAQAADSRRGREGQRHVDTTCKEDPINITT